MVNDLNSKYSLIKIICIREYKDYKIGDIFMVKDFNNEHGYIMDLEVYLKSHFIPFYEYRKKQISKIIND